MPNQGKIPKVFSRKILAKVLRSLRKGVQKVTLLEGLVPTISMVEVPTISMAKVRQDKEKAPEEEGVGDFSKYTLAYYDKRDKWLRGERK